MFDFHELEPYLEEFVDSGLGFGLFANFGSSLLGLATYVLTALALYTMAKRRGIKNPWLSWIPVVDCWIVGTLSDQYRYVVKGEVKNKRKTLLVLNIINAVICLAVIVLAVAVVVILTGGLINGNAGAVMNEAGIVPVLVMLGLCLPLFGISIAITVIRFMALYDIYTSCNPQNNVTFLVLSILFHITEPFFLFFNRNRDDGMPPRRTAPQPDMPRYEPAQES